MSYRQAWRQSPPGVRLSRRILSAKDLGADRGKPTSQNRDVGHPRVGAALYGAGFQAQSHCALTRGNYVQTRGGGFCLKLKVLDAEVRREA